MDNELLLLEANKARQVAVCLAENIYKYLGNEITKAELKHLVDSLMSDDITARFDHMYIKKDTYKNTFINGFIDNTEDFDLDTTDTLYITDIE